MSVQIQLRRDTAANWTSLNPILAQGEAGVETDTDKFKIGDGSTHWASLAYAGGGGNYQTLEVGSSAQTARAKLNLIGGTGVTVANSDNSGANSSDVTISVSGTPSVVSQFHPLALGTTNALSADIIYGHRQVIPSTGHLHDVAVFFPASQTGNARVGVYDTGDALSGSRTLLWSSGSVAINATAGWQIIGDPNLLLSAGQQVDLAVQLDSSVSVGLFLNGGYTAVEGQLPSTYLAVPGGAQPKLMWYFNKGSYGLAATVTEAQCVVFNNANAIIGRMA